PHTEASFGVWVSFDYNAERGERNIRMAQGQVKRKLLKAHRGEAKRREAKPRAFRRFGGSGLRQFEVHPDLSLDLDRFAVQVVRPVFPLSHRIDGGAAQHSRST